MTYPLLSLIQKQRLAPLYCRKGGTKLQAFRLTHVPFDACVSGQGDRTNAHTSRINTPIQSIDESSQKAIQ